MFELFGADMPPFAKFFIAFATVLALIGLTAWLVRRFGANRLGGANTRGRQPRLAVIDAATVDGRRRLVLIRRDNVEHLLMIGGPTDVVVEPNIVRAASARDNARDAAREPARPESARTEPALRQPPPVETGWPLQPINEPTPAPAARPYRTSPTEEPWLAPEPGARPRPADSSSLTGLAAELSTRLQPPEPPTPPLRSEPVMRGEPRHSPPPPAMAAEPEAPPQADHNLAEMAQQLEAALRRTALPEGRPPVTDPLAAQPAAAEPPARAPSRDYKLRLDPQFEARQEARQEPRPEPQPEPRQEPTFEPESEYEARPEPKLELPPEPRFEAPPKPAHPVPTRPKPAAPQPAATGKAIYDSLEEEMASLLGRPPGKT